MRERPMDDEHHTILTCARVFEGITKYFKAQMRTIEIISPDIKFLLEYTTVNTDWALHNFALWDGIWR